MTDYSKYLAPSEIDADLGHNVGLTPDKIPLEDLAALGGPQSPIKAIRAKCLDCCVGDASEVRKCVCHDCTLWPFRMGSSPFHARSKHSKAAAEAPHE